jgi:hypothetical protein
MPAPESATNDGSDATDLVSFVSSLSLSFFASGLHPMPANGVRRSMNKAIAKEFGKAWCISEPAPPGARCCFDLSNGRWELHRKTARAYKPDVPIGVSAKALVGQVQAKRIEEDQPFKISSITRRYRSFTAKL